MNKTKDLIDELRQTAETMQELGDLNKANLLTRAADYIEEKRLQEDTDDEFADGIKKGSVVYWVSGDFAQGWHISMLRVGNRYITGNGGEYIYLHSTNGSTTYGVPVSYLGKTVFARKTDAETCLKRKKAKV